MVWRAACRLPVRTRNSRRVRGDRTYRTMAGASEHHPAIVVIAYNRPASFSRLLSSLSQAHYPQGVPVRLVISIDADGDPAVKVIAESFSWTHGSKDLIFHETNLGLREHVLRCGDLSQTFGSVIVLEDDLYVAPYFYDYTMQALDFTVAEDRVAGVALYNYSINEFTNEIFIPLADGFDNYYLQVAASWGQAWSARQWSAFRAWYDVHAKDPLTVQDGIPKSVTEWKESSWKKYFIKYLSVTDSFFLYPRYSQSTNFADAGTHTKRDVQIYQVSLDFGPRRWSFGSAKESGSKYDVFYELDPSCLIRIEQGLEPYDFDVDLAGTKPEEALRRPYLLSSRACTTPFRSFGLDMIPLEANIACAIQGDVFLLGPRDAFTQMTSHKRLQLTRHLGRHTYINRYIFQLLKPIQGKILRLVARR